MKKKMFFRDAQSSVEKKEFANKEKKLISLSVYKVIITLSINKFILQSS